MIHNHVHCFWECTPVALSIHNVLNLFSFSNAPNKILTGFEYEQPTVYHAGNSVRYIIKGEVGGRGSNVRRAYEVPECGRVFPISVPFINDMETINHVLKLVFK